MKRSSILLIRDDNFTRLLLSWDQEKPGRGLPWAFESDPYRIWISEIMLQQTQAKTVIPFFENFIAKFPTILQLAKAPLDDVLHLWSGLGYYSRARNLHATARIIVRDYAGIFPRQFDEIIALPGIGRSTAGAICALAYGMKTPILDGNAKRVYSRYFCVDDKSDSKRTHQLWSLAEEHTPETQTAKYTQLIMDLGATVCLPNKPECYRCPIATSCCAYLNDLTTMLPVKKKSVARPQKFVVMLMLRNSTGQILLERRPTHGIWGGLWSFPEFEGSVKDSVAWFENKYSLLISQSSLWQPIHHDFTHYRLHITPLVAYSTTNAEMVQSNNSEHRFFNIANSIDVGLPVPIKKLLGKLTTS